MKIELSERGERSCRVPQIDPEVVKAIANKRYLGDHEKVETTDVEFIEADGVLLESRYGKAHEYETMLDILEWVPPALRQFIEKIWCNSKETYSYTVHLHAWHSMAAVVVGQAVEAAALGSRARGHNGITVVGPELSEDLDWDDDDYESGSFYVDPQWMEDLLKPLEVQ